MSISKGNKSYLLYLFIHIYSFTVKTTTVLLTQHFYSFDNLTLKLPIIFINTLAYRCSTVIIPFIQFFILLILILF